MTTAAERSADTERAPKPKRAKPPKRRQNPEGRMAVIDHLRELRRRLIVVLVILVAGGIVGWFLYDPVLAILKAPYCALDPGKRLGGDNGGCKLIFTQPLGGFTIKLKVSLIIGALVTSPLWLYQLWAFITPGLKRKEKRYTYLFITGSLVLFCAGVLLAYAVLYKGLAVLIGSAGSEVEAFLSVNDYLNFVVLMLLIFGAAFEVPLVIVMANLVGVLPFKVLKRGQRIGIFLIFLFAAVATPSTDPFTMCAMAVPMVILFEAAVLFAFVHDKRKAARKAAESDQQDLDDDEFSTVEAIPERLQRHAATSAPAVRPEGTSGRPAHGAGSWDDVL